MDSETRLEMLLTPWVQSWFQYPQQKMQMGNGVVTPSQSMTHKSQPVAQKYSYSWYQDGKFLPGVSCDKASPRHLFTARSMGCCLQDPSHRPRAFLSSSGLRNRFRGSGSDVESRHLDVGVDSSRRKSRQIVCPPRTPHTHAMGARLTPTRWENRGARARGEDP